MGRIGPLELVIILVIVLLVFGASRLPKLAKGLGEAKREFRKAAEEEANKSEEPPRKEG